MVAAKLARLVGLFAPPEVAVDVIAFNGAEHLVEAQDMVSEATAALGVGTTLHPGDLAHRIYNGLRAHAPEDVVTVWRDREGLAAISLLWPKWAAFDLCVRPNIGHEDLVGIVAEAARIAATDGRCETDVIVADTQLMEAVAAAGFTRGNKDHTAITAREIPERVDVPDSGFELRSARTEDVSELVEVHRGSFGGDRTVEEYAERMTKPGYDPERELVAVASDGRFAGFAIIWFDTLNRVGYFEPVGVHSDFHRRGVGSALMWEGMRRMLEAGMRRAMVMHELDDPRSSAFYATLGFERVSVISRWEKKAIE